MAKPQLGTKRVCPETGRKFYDLNKDPIVSPYTGRTYPVSYFDSDLPAEDEEEEVETKELTGDAEDAPIIANTDDDDDDDDGASETADDVPDIPDTDDIVLEDDDDDDDTFLATDDDDDDDDDVSDIIPVKGDDDSEI